MKVLLILFLVSTNIAYGANCPSVRQGKMLFVNLDYSQTEFKAAQEVAEARCLELVAVPPNQVVKSNRSEINGHSLFDLSAQYFRLREQQNQLRSSGDTNGAAQLYSQIDPLKTAIIGTELNAGDLPSQLKKAIANIQASGGYLDNTVLSGHSDGKQFAGEFTLQVTHTDLEALSSKFPKVFARNRHVMLLGCHTGTTRGSNYWRKAFPNARLFAGFEPKGPAGSSQVSGDFLRDVLSEADKIDTKLASGMATQDCLDAFDSIGAFNETYGALVYCGVEKLSHPVSCVDAWKSSLTDVNSPKGQFSGLFSQPPTMNVDGLDLDDIYNLLKQSCDLRSIPVSDQNDILALAKPKTMAELESWRELRADQLLRMRFFAIEQRNFSSWFGPDLQKLSTSLQNAGINYYPPSFSGLDSWTSIHQSVDDLESKLEALSKQNPAVASQITSSIGYQALNAFRTLDPSVFCFKWISNGSVPKSREEVGASGVDCKE